MKQLVLFIGLSLSAFLLHAQSHQVVQPQKEKYQIDRSGSNSTTTTDTNTNSSEDGVVRTNQKSSRPVRKSEVSTEESKTNNQPSKNVVVRKTESSGYEKKRVKNTPIQK